ncbi:hypothetical protein QR46_1695 [Giardia duodenalis assemblage B]|uniref:Uncharacterized protein n=1 Tax=Giardia duodenalis assemblage B TaxID=1394984 RepID=A0A132NW51_GIAIN|nr:hypothetical protein QR46_1695 [Giardia intestinalis assemblage B]
MAHPKDSATPCHLPPRADVLQPTKNMFSAKPTLNRQEDAPTVLRGHHAEPLQVLRVSELGEARVPLPSEQQRHPGRHQPVPRLRAPLHGPPRAGPGVAGRRPHRERPPVHRAGVPTAQPLPVRRPVRPLCHRRRGAGMLRRRLRPRPPLLRGLRRGTRRTLQCKTSSHTSSARRFQVCKRQVTYNALAPVYVCSLPKKAITFTESANARKQKQYYTTCPLKTTTRYVINPNEPPILQTSRGDSWYDVSNQSPISSSPHLGSGRIHLHNPYSSLDVPNVSYTSQTCDLINSKRDQAYVHALQSKNAQRQHMLDWSLANAKPVTHFHRTWRGNY